MIFKIDLLKHDLKNKRVNILKISLDEVAIQSKVSKATLSRIENGRLPDVETLGRVIEWLGTSPAKYFYFMADGSKLNISTEEVKEHSKNIIAMSTDFLLGGIDKTTYINNISITAVLLNQ